VVALTIYALIFFPHSTVWNDVWLLFVNLIALFASFTLLLYLHNTFELRDYLHRFSTPLCLGAAFIPFTFYLLQYRYSPVKILTVPRWAGVLVYVVVDLIVLWYILYHDRPRAGGHY